MSVTKAIELDQSQKDGPAASVLAESIFLRDSLRDAARDLRRPFTARALQWKVQTQWPKTGSPQGGMIVCYIDRPLVVDRLNVVVPHLWSTTFADLERQQTVCYLTVDGVTREDVGEGTTLKARRSDSLKRAAVHFGVGVSLARVPKSRLTVESKRLTARSYESKGEIKWVLEISQIGLDYLRRRYADWLSQVGVITFGAPLEHGDLGDAQGDDEPDDQLVDADVKIELYTRLTSNTTLRKQRGILAAAGVTGLAMEPRPQDIEAAVSGLSEEQGDNLRKLLDAAAENTEIGDAR